MVKKSVVINVTRCGYPNVIRTKSVKYEWPADYLDYEVTTDGGHLVLSH